MTEEKTVVVERTTVQETGTFLSQGLPFVDNDIEKALSISVAKFAGKTVTLVPAKSEIVADEANEIEHVAAVPAVEIVISEETRQDLLGAIAGLPQLRGLFTETIAEAVTEGRAGDDGYAKLLKSYQGYEKKLADAEAAILAFDEANAPGFDIQALVTWSPSEEPEIKTFVAAGASRGTRSRARSTVKWSLSEYIPSQREVDGPEATYHGIRLIKLELGNWAVETDEGRAVLTLEGEQISVASSPNKAMRGLLVTCGLSPQRSANDFWNGSEQEKA